MRTSKRVVSALLASTLIIGAAGCGGGGGRTTDAGNNGGEPAQTTAAVTTTEDPNKAIDTEVNYEDMANIEEVSSSNEEGAGKLYESGKTAGNLKVLCFYDFHNIEPDASVSKVYAERFGGTVETEICGSTEVPERLGVLMASGQSPDIIRSGWEYMPGYFINNRFQPMDDWLDINSPIWKDMSNILESYAYNGKHYYWPSNLSPNYGITYCTANVEATGCKDPMDLYFSGEWTWNEFEDILLKWKAIDPENVGISMGESSALHLAATTGTAAIEFTGTDIVNNLRNANIMRAMEFAEKLGREDLVFPDWRGPDTDASWDNLMFFIMPAEWAITCGQETWFKKGLEGKIRTVPMPRDPNSDTYSILGDSYGYLVPSGATNMQGAAAWILAARIYRTDPEVVQKNRDELMYDGAYYYIKCPECKHPFESEYGEEGETCPECGTPRKAKFKVTYDEQQMQVFDDMVDPSKFNFVFDCHRGFGADLKQQIIDIFDYPLKGTETYIQMLEENYNVVEASLDPYRQLIKEAAGS